MKFGVDTFKAIEEEHAAIVKKAENAASKKREAKAAKLDKAIEIIGGIVLVAASIIGLVVWLQYVKK